MHHVQHRQLRIGGGEGGRNNREILGDVVGDTECG